MKLLNFTIIKLTLSLIIGITIARYFEFTFKCTALALGVCLAVLAFGLLLVKRHYKFTHWFGMLAMLTTIVLGSFTVSIHDETLQWSHYLNKTSDYDQQHELLVKISKRLKPTDYNNKYIAELLQLNSENASGQLLLNIEKDSSNNRLPIDAVCLVSTSLSEVSKPKNPFQFDYNTYLKERQIYHQIYANQTELLEISTQNKTLHGYADALRSIINTKLIAAGLKDDTLAVVNALLLGQRQDISAETYNNYKNAGTIHILAVSGLHVGIIYFILLFVFKPLERLPYGRHLIVPILVVLGLWSFAVVAGLSPSVTRATTMFSIVAMAKFLKRPTNIYNTLCISAFILLLCKPQFLFDVGFQMSYLAVFAIVSIQPLLYNLWQPKWYVLDKPWQIFTVTIAAQLGVAPISLYYFHQFPGLFFISNLVVIPLLGLILGFGLLIIVLALLNILPKVFAEWFSITIETLNQFIAWVAQFEYFLLKDIPFNGYQVVSIYLVIIGGVLLWTHKTYTYLRFTLVSLVLFSAVLLYTKHKNSTNEFVIFNTSKTTLIAQKSNSILKIHHSNDSLNKSQLSALRNYTVGHAIDKVKTDSLHAVYGINTKKMLVIDSSSVYEVTGFTPDYILLRQSPRVNLLRVIDSLLPKYIIADASNYTSYVARWKATCEAKKIPFHSTYEKGAFIFNLK